MIGKKKKKTPLASLFKKIKLELLFSGTKENNTTELIYMIKIINKYGRQLYTSNFNNLEELGKFLEGHKIQENIKNLSGHISILKIDCII